MRVHVAFTPAETASAPVAVVVDVMRATSTIVQALEAGYRRVHCCAEVEEALALREELGHGVLAGERLTAKIPGFDLGNSPREFVEPRGDVLILTTTNGTRSILAAAAQCETVLIGSLLNLGAIVEAARERGGDVTVVCAGTDGRLALEDAYCAGRFAELVAADRSDAAEVAVRLARSFATPEEALRASDNPRHRNLEDDIVWCARERVSDVVPVFVGMHGAAAEITR